MLNAKEKAFEVYNHALKYVSAYHSNIADPEAMKKQAKLYAQNVVSRMKAAVYDVCSIDDYTPRKTLDFYRSVSDIIEAL